jgi:hypothetical protein
MNARDVVAYQALLRLVELIERHEPLRRRAAESQALDRLREQIQEIERLAHDGTIAGRTSPMLTASKEALRKLLWTHMDTVQQAVECSLLAGTLLPNLSPPPLDCDIMLLTTHAKAIVTLARQHEEALKRAGLEWSLIADIATLAESLGNAVSDRHVAVVTARVSNNLIPVVLRAARVQVGLLQRQLAPVMAPEILGEWKAAAALGRKHRAAAATQQLEAPPEVKALPPAPAAVALESPTDARQLPAARDGVVALPPSPEMSLLAIAAKAGRAVLRLLRPSEGQPVTGQEADVSVTEIRRLPSSTQAKTGTDDGR